MAGSATSFIARIPVMSWIGIFVSVRRSGSRSVVGMREVSVAVRVRSQLGDGSKGWGWDLLFRVLCGVGENEPCQSDVFIPI